MENILTHVWNTIVKIKIFTQHLAAEKQYSNLDVSIGEVLPQRNDWFEGVESCRLSDRLIDIIHQMVKAEVHRLVVQDENGHLTGILSLSDLLSFLIIRPVGTLYRCNSRKKSNVIWYVPGFICI